MNDRNPRHDTLVAEISVQLNEAYPERRPFRLYHGSTNSTRHSPRDRENIIDTTLLNQVVQVDTINKTVLAEPNVPMDDLVATTLKHGLVPLVVMEFPGITVGGGFSGTSGESSSFRYGAFEATVNMIEIVLIDGTVANASKDNNQDLFWGTASGFGTFGIVTMLEVQLKDAAPYVELTYRLARSPEETMLVLKEECGKPSNDYVDGIVYSKDSAIICAGRMVHRLPNGREPVTLLGRYDPWFYLQAQKAERQLHEDGTMTVTDYIPITDYLFRYDRGAFWTAKYSFNYFLTPFNRITRAILDMLLHARVMYRALHHSGLADSYMIQDVAVPTGRAAEFQHWLHDRFAIYPLWLCPLRVQRDAPDSAYGLHFEFGLPNCPDMMSFGIWGPLSGNRQAVIGQNRALEQKVYDLNGKKWLYGQTFYTEDEFWSHYDRQAYDNLRQKYGSSRLPSVYDKVRLDLKAEEERSKERGIWGRWPLAGLWGVYKALQGEDYLLRNKSQ